MANSGTHNEMNYLSDEIVGSSNRTFGLFFAALLFVLGAFPLFKGKPAELIPIGVAVVLLVVSLTRDSWLKPFNRIWIGIGVLLGKIVSPVVLGVFFFGVLAPIGIIFRIRRIDLLKMKIDSKKKSYWISRDKAADSIGSMKNQY